MWFGVTKGSHQVVTRFLAELVKINLALYDLSFLELSVSCELTIGYTVKRMEFLLIVTEPKSNVLAKYD